MISRDFTIMRYSQLKQMISLAYTDENETIGTLESITFHAIVATTHQNLPKYTKKLTCQGVTKKGGRVGHIPKPVFKH